MAISDAEIRTVVADYLTRYPTEADLLADPVQQLSTGVGFASRHTFPMHVTVGALLLRGDEVLLVHHRAYDLLLQPGGHVEPGDVTLLGAAVRELVEETGVDPDLVAPTSHHPAYIEYGPVPARPERGEPAHFHLDIGYSFTGPPHLAIGRIQQSEVAEASWRPLAEAERLVGSRIARAVSASEHIR